MLQVLNCIQIELAYNTNLNRAITMEVNPQPIESSPFFDSFQRCYPH